MARWSAATAEFDQPEPLEEEDDGRRRRVGGRKLSFLLVLLALVFLGYAALRIIGLESTAFLVGAMAATPYVAAGGLLLGLVTLLLRRRRLALIVLLMTLGLGALLAPRILSEEQPGADGEHVRIMSANVHLGQADARTIVDLVRQQQVDVLALPELTPDLASDLDTAGLRELLPYQVFDARPGADGSGIAARLPVRQIVLIESSTMSQPTAVVDVPGRDDLELTAVHIQPALKAEDARTWRDELAGLPPPTPRERVRVLAGDFNATLDHGALRKLIDSGYADAGEETGNGMQSTWSSWPFGPPLTLDHILTDVRCAIGSYAVFDLPGSDHNVVLAEIVLP